MSSSPDSLRVIRADLEHKSQVLYESSTTSKMIRCLASDGSSAVVLYRISEILYKTPLAPLGFIISKINKVINGIVIGRGATIGKGFVIQHPNGVVINGSAVIGDDCVMQSGVTIGAHSVRLRDTPRIGHNVAIGSGAKLIGGITIGDDVQIGANAVVTNDIASGVTAVGVPAKPL